LHKYIAKLHWILAHTAPFIRGSAAITEWIIKGIYKSYDLSIRWSKMPDCMALIQPNMEEYAKAYAEFSIIDKNLTDQANKVTESLGKFGMHSISQAETVVDTSKNRHRDNNSPFRN
jgi:hypothetical protein